MNPPSPDNLSASREEASMEEDSQGWQGTKLGPIPAKDFMSGGVLPGRRGEGLCGTGTSEAQLQRLAGVLEHPGLY